jgi:diguanylate cyclase (GGDEF)-like protein
MKATIVENLAVSVVDALTSNICVVDLTGEILSVNRAWMEFSAGNAGGAEQDYIGKNYLNVCQSSTGPASEEAPGLYDGLQDVLEGRTDIFDIEYPCHSPTERRWFLARVTPLIRKRGTKDAQQVGAVVSHMNITDRKLIELDYAKLASTDSLTDLPNRRFFEQYAKIELERLRRFGGNMSVLMMDLDNFKLINDRHGHLAGDVVLKKVAAGCKAAFRGSDLFARIGGEEFVALLLGTDEAGAILQAEKLRAIVENLRIKTESATFRVTISIGVALVAPKDRSINSSLSRADKALYAAKSSGRNRVHASAYGHGFVSS